MATPKLKVYRLDQNYTQTNDNDIQSLSNDELLPVVPKNLNVFNAQEMVGIRQRGDSRMVIQSGWQVIEIPFNTTDITNPATIPVSCQGWVLGKGNIKLYIQKQKKSDINSSRSQDEYQYQYDSHNYLYKIPSNFTFADRKYWDYEIKTLKRYGKYLKIQDFNVNTDTEGNQTTNNGLFTKDNDNNSFVNIKEIYINNIHYNKNECIIRLLNNSSSQESTEDNFLEIVDGLTFSKYYLESYENFEGADEVHQIDEIIFKIGQWMENTWTPKNEYVKFIQKTSDSSSSQTDSNLCENKIYIVYKKYREFGSQNVFGNNSGISMNDISIYNENIEKENERYSDSSYIPNNVNQSKYRVPFGDIYNGNKKGRCLPCIKIDGGGDPYYRTTLQDDEKLSDLHMKYYEGNYLYRKNILPLRYMVAQESLSSSSEFIPAISSEFIPSTYEYYEQNNINSSSSSEIIENYILKNGECFFYANKGWYTDGILEPIVFQRITVDVGTPHERKIFKKLELENQARLILSYKNNQIGYQFSFISDYYLKSDGQNYAYPKEIFLIYNLHDDFSSNIFDFDYNYHDYFSLSSSVNEMSSSSGNSSSSENYKFDNYTEMFLCGYANRGYLHSQKLNEPSFNSEISETYQYLPLYLKKEKLAVLDGDYGRDKNRDLLLQKITDDDLSYLPSSQENPSSSPISSQKIEFLEKINEYGITSSSSEEFYDLNNGIDIGGILHDSTFYFCNIIEKDELFSDTKGIKIYLNGQKIWELHENSNSGENYYTSNYDIYYENGKFIIADKQKKELIKDLMIVYYQKYKMFPINNHPANQNPCFLGYRIPCYEKIKKSNYFVSSFPNWVKGHLNNDLDVFVGNTTYSGTDTAGNGSNGIYPCYKKDGWYPMYSQGAIKFNQEIVEFDYFDLYNYGGSFVENADEVLYLDNNYYPTVPTYLSNPTETLKLYYQKVKYNVAYYDGIISVLRGHLSNYTIQNGSIDYALLEDEDYQDSIGKKWVIRKDNYIRRIFQSEQRQLPEIANSQTKEQADVFSEYIIKGQDRAILKVNTNDDRIKIISFYPSFNKGDGLIICLNRNNKNYIEKLNAYNELLNQDIRIHIGVNSADYTLCVGMEENPITLTNDTNYNILFQYPEYDENHNLINGDENYVAVNWYALPDMDDLYDNLSIDQIQNNPITVNEINNSSSSQNIGIMRYKYSNKDWEYDVYFEIFSYRYLNNNTNENTKYKGVGSPVNSIEFAVYRVLK